MVAVLRHREFEAPSHHRGWCAWLDCQREAGAGNPRRSIGFLSGHPPELDRASNLLSRYLEVGFEALSVVISVPVPSAGKRWQPGWPQGRLQRQATRRRTRSESTMSVPKGTLRDWSSRAGSAGKTRLGAIQGISIEGRQIVRALPCSERSGGNLRSSRIRNAP